MPNYATRYVDGKPQPAQEARLGDLVRQVAWGANLGRLEDTGRSGTVVTVNRVKVIVDFGFQTGHQAVNPEVLTLLERVRPAPRPQQIPGMARLMPLTPALLAHYSD